MRRMIAALAAILLLLPLGQAFASGAGSQQDPLISRSYVRRWEELLLADRAAQADQAAQALITDGARSLEMLTGRCGASGIRPETLSAGGSILLREGDSINLLSGGGSVTVRSGSLIDVTDGTVLPAGKLPAGHRCIAAKDAYAVFTAAQDSRLSLTGTAVVSQYRDSAPTQWYGSAVDYAAVRALMNGTGEGTFSPESTLTRAMFVTILGRMAGVNAADWPGTSFTDVPTNTWFSAYVQWGAKNGIVNGIGGGQFAPNSPVTREQMAVLITRYADAAGYDLPRGVSVRAYFQDAARISDWAGESVERMRVTGLLNGDDLGNFNPANGATRAEAATVFMRLDATLRLLH